MSSLRPSPSKHARAFIVGARRRGNDGAIYEVRLTKNGVRRWVRVSDNSAKVDVIVVLRPSTTPSSKSPRSNLADYAGPRALTIVQTSLKNIASVKRIKTIAFDMQKWVYYIEVSIENLEDFQFQTLEDSQIVLSPPTKLTKLTKTTKLANLTKKPTKRLLNLELVSVSMM